MNKTKCIDIFEILICIRFINRSNTSQRIKNGFKIFANIRITILKYFDIKSQKTMIDQKNIFIFDMFANKRLIRSIIKRVTHVYKHVQNERKIDEILKMIQLRKFLFIYVYKNKKLTIRL